MAPLTAARVKARALEVGFDLCGIAPVGDFPELKFLDEWLARGYAGEMAYMARAPERRSDVRAVLPSARSVIVTATVYNTDRPYSTASGDERQAKLSRYAWGDDYHDIIKARLDGLVEWMRAEHEASTGVAADNFNESTLGSGGERSEDAHSRQSRELFEARAYVDTGPVLERVYAQYAGIGWIGKNTCVISGKRGSWLFLSEILCSLPLEPDAPATDHCGTCTRCLDACPTEAIRAPGVLDATRCISYLTIELKTAIPEPLRVPIGRHVYGCDICQDVCPWNRTPLVSARPEWQPRPGLDAPALSSLWSMTDDELRKMLKGSPMKRTGVKRLRRNLAVAIANSQDPEAHAALEASGAPEASTSPTSASGQPDAGRPSLSDPLVAEHIEWARGEIRKRR
jgi:epoxyqueuosine reductase